MKAGIGSMIGQPSYAQMLLQAQEQKTLAQRLINIKPSVDNKEPKRFI